MLNNDSNILTEAHSNAIRYCDSLTKNQPDLYVNMMEEYKSHNRPVRDFIKDIMMAAFMQGYYQAKKNE